MYKNIMSALEDLLRDIEGCALHESYFTRHRTALTYLRKKLKLTEIQCLIVALLVECGTPVCFRELAVFLGLKRVGLMTHAEDFEELVRKRWMRHATARYRGEKVKGYVLQQGVVEALQKNERYRPASLTAADDGELVNTVTRFHKRCKNDFLDPLYLQDTWIAQLVADNPDRPLCREMMRRTSFESAILLRLVADYDEYHDTWEEGVDICEEIEAHTDCEEDLLVEADLLRHEAHPLIRAGLIAPKCEDGMARNGVFVITRKTLDELLPGYRPAQGKSQGKSADRNLIAHCGISYKPLFFNPEEQEGLERLSQMLVPTKLHDIQRRLVERGRRKGLTVLLYGAPGTGKTEFVLQVCKATGRDCFHVDLSAIRSKWVGESEANIRQVFRRYASLCQGDGNMPVLLFNEADGIFTRRNVQAVNACDKSENTIQNIILEEMENFDGILIATSNLLQTTMDAAMARRFLYKMELKKPGKAVRARIWQTMMPELPETVVEALSARFDLSGGEIENVVRKCEIDYFIDGRRPTLDKLMHYCANEKISNNNDKIRGFT